MALTDARLVMTTAPARSSRAAIAARPKPPLDFASGLPARSTMTAAELDAAIEADAAEQKAKRVRQLLDVCGLPPEHRTPWDHGSRALPSTVRAGLADLADTLARWSQTQAIVGVVGNRGTGKSTTCAREIVRLCHLGVGARYVLARVYAREAYESRSYASTVRESEIERRYAAPPLLVIDEMHLMLDAAADETTVRGLIQRRWDEKKCTVLVANERPEPLAKRLGDSVVTRMQRRGDSIVCDWPSI